MKFPIINEKIATPIIRINEAISRSKSDLGWKSPYPTVERVVKEK
jgi:hypothetical protein